jgi:hypothetical protein
MEVTKMIKFIGVDGENAVNSETVLKQIEEIKKYELNIYDVDGNKIEWKDLDNENDRSLFRNIYLDRKVRIDEKTAMADRPQFAVCTIEDNKIIRLEFYEGHDSLKLEFDLRRKEDFDKDLKPYMQEDENAYNPLEFLQSLGISKELANKAIELTHANAENDLTLKELRTKKNIQKKYVAGKLKISSQGYTWKEDGEREFTVSELEILCKEFNKSEKDMITIIKNSKKEK